VDIVQGGAGGGIEFEAVVADKVGN